MPADTTPTLEGLRARPTAPEVEPLLLTARQAAAALSISERTLWQLTRDGAVRCVRLGRAVRYDRRDLIALIDQRK
jgi:excisionase family DNA binding protein